jgi:hypothetical protein
MSRKDRVPRPDGDLNQQLIDQLVLLRADCASYDNGLEASGKRIAVSLRILLHHQGQSKALLEQLNLRQGVFYSSAEPIPDHKGLEITGALHLVGYNFNWETSRARVFPLVNANDLPWYRIFFFSWWEDRVLIDTQGRGLSRKTLVLNVADTDGGAHVDPSLDAVYRGISRERTLEFARMVVPGGVAEIEGRIELACMRQIAHELLKTLHERPSDFRPHAEPVVPQGAKPDTPLRVSRPPQP